MESDNIESLLTTPNVRYHLAEKRLSDSTPGFNLPQSHEDTQRIIQGLKIREIKLKIKNEELRTARYQMQTVLEKYVDLYESAPVSYFTLSRSGSICAVNLTGANLLRIERSLLIGRCFEQLITEECRSAFTAFLGTVFSNRVDETCEVVLPNNVNLPIRVRIGATVTASGEECRLALINVTGQREAGQPLEYISDIPGYSEVESAA